MNNKLEGATIGSALFPAERKLAKAPISEPNAVWLPRPTEISNDPFRLCLSLDYDAQRIDFDDDLIYGEVATPISKRKIPMKQLLRGEALTGFAEWAKKMDRVRY